MDFTITAKEENRSNESEAKRKKCRVTACNEPQHMPPNHKEQAERALGTVAPPSRFWGPELINNTRKLPRADGPLTHLQARNAGGLNRKCFS